VMGTPAYMSPEQARGEALDARSDLFALGAVFYHACAGQLPFPGPNAATVLMALASQPPKPPRALCPAVPRALSDLVLQMLATDPGDRPASVQEVADRLERVECEVASAGKPGRRIWRWAAACLAVLFVPVAIWLAGVVLRVESPEGTLVIK